MQTESSKLWMGSFKMLVLEGRGQRRKFGFYSKFIREPGMVFQQGV